MNKVEKLIILGSGPAGLTAAVYASRAGLEPLIFEGPNPGGQLMTTTAVENWPGDINIMGPQLMMNMREHAKHFGTKFSDEKIAKADLSVRPFILETESGKKFKSHSIIISTGAVPKKLKVTGEDKFWGKGVSTCAVCDGAFYRSKKVVIIGGGDTAMEEASFMRNFTEDITVIHILPELTASKAMQERVLNDPKIKIIYNASVTAILGDEKVSGVEYLNKQTNKKEQLEADGIFVAIGLVPTTELFKGQLELTKSGHIQLKDCTGTQTSVDGVFTAGDVADAKYRQAITSAGTGCAAALDAERYIKSLKI
ncbi:thioredoxin-disulfide reductase [Candidatus Dependentiae bacterium]|nr:thioredoxin-disulfide reductase [Candidatus Dependentiae bacterium]